VARTPPQLDAVSTNGEPSYAAADLDALVQEMGTVRAIVGTRHIVHAFSINVPSPRKWMGSLQTKRIQLSLVAPHFIHELEWMVAAVARAQRIEPARPTTSKQGHVVILSNITLLRDLVSPAGSPRTPQSYESLRHDSYVG